MADDSLKRLSEFILLKAFGQSSTEIRSSARSRLMQGVVFMAALLLGMAAFILGLITVYLYLRQSLPALEATAVMTAAFVVLTFLLWLVAFLIPRLRPVKTGEKEDAEKPSPDPTAAVIRSAVEIIAKHPLKAGITAIIAGMLVGYSPEVRALLLKALSPDGNEDEPEA